MSKIPLKEAFAGLVYDLFRAAGMPINQTNQEKLENMAPRFAAAIQQEARETSLTLAKRLQAAVLDGFEKFAGAIGKAETDIKELQNEVKRLSAENAELRKGSAFNIGLGFAEK